jgi:hypothetical protein
LSSCEQIVVELFTHGFSICQLFARVGNQTLIDFFSLKDLFAGANAVPQNAHQTRYRINMSKRLESHGMNFVWLEKSITSVLDDPVAVKIEQAYFPA